MNDLSTNIDNLNIDKNKICILYSTSKLGIRTEIVISKCDYEELNKYTWRLFGNYVKGTVNNKLWTMHRYIMIVILKNDVTSKVFIDHIDGNKTNNSRSNLRLSNVSDNSRNIKKRTDLTSQFMGVCFDKKSNKWKMKIKISGKEIIAFYDNENHAAHHYDIILKEYKLNSGIFNNIQEDKLINFKLYIKKQYKRKEKNISITKCNKYSIIIQGKYITTCDTLEDAIISRDNKIKELNKLKEENIKNIPVLYNINNECIFEVFNKNKEKVCDVIIDKDMYHKLIKIKWHYDGGYIKNNTVGRLHRYIMNYNGENVVDHKDGNPLNNKKENLRICTTAQNNMNRRLVGNYKSKYVGITKTKNEKWIARITINNNRIYLGTFDNEIDAVRARDESCKKHHGDFAILNFPNVIF